jgi:hypothetical protein
MNCCLSRYSFDAKECPSIRQTMSAANTSVIAPVPSRHAANARVTNCRFASVGEIEPSVNTPLLAVSRLAGGRISAADRRGEQLRSSIRPHHRETIGSKGLPVIAAGCPAAAT